MSQKCPKCGEYQYHFSDGCQNCKNIERIKQEYPETITIKGKDYSAKFEDPQTVRGKYVSKMLPLIKPALLLDLSNYFKTHSAQFSIKEVYDDISSILIKHSEYDSLSPRSISLVAQMPYNISENWMVKQKRPVRYWDFERMREQSHYEALYKITNKFKSFSNEKEIIKELYNIMRNEYPNLEEFIEKNSKLALVEAAKKYAAENRLGLSSKERRNREVENFIQFILKYKEK